MLKPQDANGNHLPVNSWNAPTPNTNTLSALKIDIIEGETSKNTNKLGKNVRQDPKSIKNAPIAAELIVNNELALL